MTRAHPWLPHPAKTLGPRLPCPNGTRYTSRDRAWDATHPLTGNSRQTPVPCERDDCAGWHLAPTTKESTR